VTLRIGTRRSRLALAQAQEVADLLGRQGETPELVPILTQGDRGAPSNASPSGLKGLFVAEIVHSLLRGEVDLAVHSAKDLPAEDDPGVAIAAVPPRASPFDVLVTRESQLADGAVVGTSSLRRHAQLRRARPHLSVVELRGNVDTRLAKLEAGGIDALVLAEAGLARLGASPPHRHTMHADEMVPAPGQGALAVQAREDDDATLAALARLDDSDSRRALTAERALMARLGGGCSLPLGAYASMHGDRVHLIAVVVSPDGTRIVRAEAEALEPEQVAATAADHLLRDGAGDILDAVRAGEG
jgi:hydroxymethylbilane synthase